MKLFHSILFLLFSACFSVFPQDSPERSHADQLFRSGKYEAAIPVLKECLNAQPNDLSVQKMLAKSLFNTGNMDSAYILYKEIVVCYSDDYDTYVFLGNYYYVKANNLAKRTKNPDERRTRSSRHRKEEGRTVREVIFEYYHNASEYLEKAYNVRSSDEIMKSLIDIYTITGNKDKVSLYQKRVKSE